MITNIFSFFLISQGYLAKNLGIPKIGNNKSAHQARFHSSPINRSPNSVWKLTKFCLEAHQIWIIRTHPNSSKSPNLVIQVTRITKYLVIRLFGFSGDPKKTEFGNKSGSQIWHKVTRGPGTQLPRNGFGSGTFWPLSATQFRM
jgi:hypothetical protein